MKIIHLINTLSAGGAELHLLTLAKHLKREGLEQLVVCLREHVKGSRSLRSDFEGENIRVINLQADGRYDCRFLVRFARLLKKNRPDILHTHLPRADFAGAFARFFYPTIVWVCSLHNIYNRSWSGRWALPLVSSVWHQADGIIAISHAVKDWLVKARGLSSEKITVIHYGIESEQFSRPNADLKETWDLNAKAIIGSIGRLEPRKGHECLIQAMPAILKHVPNAFLLIAGHDPLDYGKNLQRLIHSLDLNKQVRLVGFQSDIASFLGALDVFAFATRSEGFGQVLVEAMAAGKPVVSSKIPPITEIVGDGETGLLVNADDPNTFANAITWLLTHPEQAQQMGKRGRERVYSQFLAQRMRDETLSLYKALLKSYDYGLVYHS